MPTLPVLSEASPSESELGHLVTARYGVALEVLAYQLGHSDAEVTARVEAGLSDPRSEERQFLAALGKKARGEPLSPDELLFFPRHTYTDAEP